MSDRPIKGFGRCEDCDSWRPTLKDGSCFSCGSQSVLTLGEVPDETRLQLERDMLFAFLQTVVALHEEIPEELHAVAQAIMLMLKPEEKTNGA